MSHSVCRSGAVLLAAAMLLPVPLAGQVLHGRVVESSGAPLPEATIELRLDSLREGAIADRDGRFTIVLPASGIWELVASRIGYLQSGPSRVEIAPGEQVTVVVRMAVDAIPLAPLEVTLRRRVPTALEQIYSRIETLRERGVGRGITRAEIERMDPQTVGRLVASMSGRVRPIESKDPTVNTIWLRDGTRGSGHCAPAVFIDGFQVNQRPANINMLIDPRQVEAAELYVGAAQVPIGFHDPRGCGSVLIWSRRGSPQEGRPNTWMRWAVAGVLGLGMVLLLR